MRVLIASVGSFAALLLVAPFGASLHAQGCVPTTVDPSTIITVDLSAVGLGVYYHEERDAVPVREGIPWYYVPGYGALFGTGSWTYIEANGLPGLQRGGTTILDEDGCFFPPPGGLPCMIAFSDYVNDYSCGHGPDQLVV